MNSSDDDRIAVFLLRIANWKLIFKINLISSMQRPAEEISEKNSNSQIWHIFYFETIEDFFVNHVLLPRYLRHQNRLHWGKSTKNIKLETFVTICKFNWLERCIKTWVGVDYAYIFTTNFLSIHSLCIVNVCMCVCVCVCVSFSVFMCVQLCMFSAWVHARVLKCRYDEIELSTTWNNLYFGSKLMGIKGEKLLRK